MSRSLIMLVIVSAVIILTLMVSALFFDYEMENRQPPQNESFNALLKTKRSLSTTTILFTGDVMLARKVEVLSKQNGLDYPFANLNLPTDYDYMVGNFEAVVPKNHQPTPYFKYAFSVPTSSVEAAKEFGFTHFSLANNHSYDFGEAEYLHTREVFTDLGIGVFGDQKISTSTSISYIETDAGTVALVGLHAVDTAPDSGDLAYLTEQVSANSIKQIAYVHWGTEYQAEHSEFQEEFATELVGMGYDLIIGHHPHVVQDVGIIDGVPVFYSLGNFIFDQYFSADVQQGLILAYSFGQSTELELIPVSSIGSQSSPYLMSGKSSREFLAKIASSGDPVLADMILSRQIEFSK